VPSGERLTIGLTDAPRALLDPEHAACGPRGPPARIRLTERSHPGQLTALAEEDVCLEETIATPGSNIEQCNFGVGWNDSRA